jgi:hypothetical protein
MASVERKYLRYLEIAGDFAAKHPFLDTAIFTFYQGLDDGEVQHKKFTYAIKLLIFPLYVFSKHFQFRSFLSRREVPRFTQTNILAIVHGSGPQHFGDLVKIIEDLDRKNRGVLVVCGSVSPSQMDHLRTLKNVYLLDQTSIVFAIGIIEFVKNTIKSIGFLRALYAAARKDNELVESFSGYGGFLLEHFFVCLCHLNFSQKVIQDHSFKVVFSSSDGNVFARGYFIHANRQKIRNFILQHGFVGLLHTKLIADQVVQWSRKDVDYFVKCGFPKERILPLGLPRFDDIKNERISPEHLIASSHGVESVVATICFFVAIHEHESELEYSREVLDQVNALIPTLREKGIRLVIRAHPNDDLQQYNNFLSREAKEYAIIPDASFPLVQLLKQMDLCVMPWSTAIIEAMICNVPVLFLNFRHHWDQYEGIYNFDSTYLGLEITDSSQLLPAIEKTIFNVSYREALKVKQSRYVEDDIINLGTAKREIVKQITSWCG